jgi:hypothetical protein
MLLNSFDPKSPDYMPYRLFLMHFMAVDDMGHLHGVTTDYNPYNTYQKVLSLCVCVCVCVCARACVCACVCVCVVCRVCVKAKF